MGFCLIGVAEKKGRADGKVQEGFSILYEKGA